MWVSLIWLAIISFFHNDEATLTTIMPPFHKLRDIVSVCLFGHPVRTESHRKFNIDRKIFHDVATEHI